jgi:hypothetical protein
MILYRHNNVLAERVEKFASANNDRVFTKVYPADMSIEDISMNLPTAGEATALCGVANKEDIDIRVDGTVLSAMMEEARRYSTNERGTDRRLYSSDGGSQSPAVIRQDDGDAYEEYTDIIAKVAGTRTIVLVLKFIEDHNYPDATEDDPYPIGTPEKEKVNRERVIQEWIARFKRRGCTFDLEGSKEALLERIRKNPSEDLVVVCDHHEAKWVEGVPKEQFFNAFPPFRD